VSVANLVFSAGVLAPVLPLVPQEIVDLRAAVQIDALDYKFSILSLIELAVFLQAAITLFWRPMPKVLIWLGFAANFGLSLLALIFAFTFEFRCCGYL
jgi:hypothetical protein